MKKSHRHTKAPLSKQLSPSEIEAAFDGLDQIVTVLETERGGIPLTPEQILEALDLSDRLAALA